MDSSEILLLIAIIILAVIVWGGGTAVFCCTGFEGSLPFNSMNSIEDKIMNLESGIHTRAKEMIFSVNDISNILTIQANELAELPKNRYVLDHATFIDLELGLEDQGKTKHCAPLRIMVSPAPETIIQIPE